MKFRKKPVVIDAMQWTGDNLRECIDFLGDSRDGTSGKGHATEIYIATMEGVMVARVGDWLIQGVKGEFYPCKPDIFEATYEKVEE